MPLEHVSDIINRLFKEWEANMPNKAAKLKKQQRHKLNEELSVNGRTASQIARNKLRNNKRKGTK